MVEGSLFHNLYLNISFSSYFPVHLFEEREGESSWVVASQVAKFNPPHIVHMDTKLTNFYLK